MTNNDTIKEQVTRTLDAWSTAIVNNDVEGIARFMTDDWIIIDGPGIFDRSGFLSAVDSGLLPHDTMTHEVHEFRALGDVCILVTHGRNTGTFKGKPFTNDEWVTEVFQRINGDWRCRVTHLTPVRPRNDP